MLLARPKRWTVGGSCPTKEMCVGGLVRVYHLFGHTRAMNAAEEAAVGVVPSTPIRDTSCCDHPLTAFPCLSLGTRGTSGTYLSRIGLGVLCELVF